MRLPFIVICCTDVPFKTNLTVCTYYIIFVYNCLFIQYIFVIHYFFGHKWRLKYKINVKKNATNYNASTSYYNVWKSSMEPRDIRKGQTFSTAAYDPSKIRVHMAWQEDSNT